MATALFISRNDILKTTPLQGSIDADRLLPFVKAAQEKQMVNLLGTVLYNKLQDDIIAQTPFEGKYLELMNDHIKPTLIWYAVAEYLPFSAVQFRAEGAVKHETETAKPVSKNEVDYLIGKTMQSADYYATRLQDFLIAYSNDIPEYLQSVGNTTQQYPDMGNVYFSGLQL